MKKILSTVAILGLLSTPAFAGNHHNNRSSGTDIEVETKVYGGDSDARAMGIGKGGDANAKGGNAKAYGGNSSQGQGQDQEQQQRQIGINKNDNKNLGFVNGENSLDAKVQGHNKNNIKNDVNTSDYNKVDTKVNTSDVNFVKTNSESDSGVYGSGNSANLNRGGDNSATTGSQDVNVNVDGDSIVYEAPDIPVETAYAPTVISTSDCLGSLSAGGQSSFWGATFGITTQSEPCNVREDAKVIASLVKDEALVKATLCQSDRVAEAYKVTGDYYKYCVGAKEETKTSHFGLVSTKAYEDVCKYPTEACKRFKRGIR